VRVFFKKILLALFLAVFVHGCSTLPARVPLSEQESLKVRTSFKEMAIKQGQCSSSADADIVVTLDSKFYSGTMSGYLQAMAPAALKIIGVNPFGQPLVVLISDGEHFSYSLLNESLSYSGTVDSAAFKRYAPTGFAPDNSFYLLIGRLKPGRVLILDDGADPDGKGAWLELENEQDGTRSLVLFDPDRQLLVKYLQLDESGSPVMEMLYSEHYSGPCNLPGKIKISSIAHSGSLEVMLSNWQSATPFSPNDFKFDPPTGFKRVTVK
jgi:outer membrane lipoprotein-sorting protein